ncbi:MAG: DNA ligase (ATP) (EC [uncultured Sulfurovum sp.]|uniref:DNA ligase (ATP) (EC) n=1 Tax=uncultured Sulfurovum sp. TaxID=269237 RepID=A0A6S6TYD5_9BACT|nr:MAG: DNA ligase (ATP) (EC [uncultured Sulfurovum sp.]
MYKQLFFLIFFVGFLQAEKPNLLLLKSYNNEINVTNWLISEKLDGVRAYWNGKKLVSRNGKVFAAPAWFVKDFPPFEIDGELWTKRGDFENVISIVNRQSPHEGWRNISYQIFEVPNQKGGLLERLDVLEKWLVKNPNKFIKVLPQKVCKGSEHLKEVLDEVERKGAEGLVVRESNALYIGKRSKSSLKVKSFQDDECVVNGYTKGKGKFEGLVGALLCEWKDRTLKIGSGLSLEDRKIPPVLDANITFKYNGLTKYGNPKFPVFLRVRKIP